MVKKKKKENALLPMLKDLELFAKNYYFMWCVFEKFITV